MNLNIKNNIQILNLTLHNICDREFYNFQIIFRTGYCYKTHFLFFQLVLSPKTPVLRRLFFIPLAKLGVTVLFVLYTPFFQLFFHIHAVANVRAHSHTLKILFLSISHLILSLTHLPPTRPFLYSFLHRLSFRCMNRQCTSWERKESNKTKHCRLLV